MTAAPDSATAPLLVVFGGLPGTGKSTLATGVARALSATYLRVDAIEAAVIGAGLVPDQPAVGVSGYVIAHRVADSGLRTGLDVVVDAVNPVEVARAGWRELAAATGARLTFVEVTCSDPARHRDRVDRRASDLADWEVPDWAAVTGREYEPWTGPRIEIDNVGDPGPYVEQIVKAVTALA